MSMLTIQTIALLIIYIKALSNIAFSKLMKFNDFTQETGRSNKTHWKNIKIIENVDM